MSHRRRVKHRTSVDLATYPLPAVDPLLHLMRNNSASAACAQHWSLSAPESKPCGVSLPSYISQLFSRAGCPMPNLRNICRDENLAQMKTSSDLHLYPREEVAKMQECLNNQEPPCSIHQLELLRAKQRQCLRPNPRKRQFPDMVQVNEAGTSCTSGTTTVQKKSRCVVTNDNQTTSSTERVVKSARVAARLLEQHQEKQREKETLKRVGRMPLDPSLELFVRSLSFMCKANAVKKSKKGVVLGKPSSYFKRSAKGKKSQTVKPPKPPSPPAQPDPPPPAAPLSVNETMLAQMPKRMVDLLKGIRYRCIDREDKENSLGFWIRDIPKQDFVLLDSRSPDYSFCVTIGDIRARCVESAKARYDVLLLPMIWTNTETKQGEQPPQTHTNNNSVIINNNNNNNNELPLSKVNSVHEGDIEKKDGLEVTSLVVPVLGTAEHPQSGAEVPPTLIVPTLIRPLAPRVPTVPVRHVAKVYTKKSTMPSILKHNRAKLLSQMASQSMANFNMGATNGYSAPISTTVYAGSGPFDSRHNREKVAAENRAVGSRLPLSHSSQKNGGDSHDLIPLPQRWLSAMSTAAAPAAIGSHRSVMFAAPPPAMMRMMAPPFVRPPAIAANPRLLTSSLRHQMYPTPNGLPHLPPHLGPSSHIVPPVAVVKKSTWQVSKAAKPAVRMETNSNSAAPSN